MLHSKHNIDDLIQTLVEYLSSIQNKDGSFEASFYFPSQPEKGWAKWGNPSYDTATIVLSLLGLKIDKAQGIITKANQFLIDDSLDKKAWKYPSGQGYEPLLYDTDATAICSLVLASCGHEINNKSFLNSFIDKDNNYKAWIMPKLPIKNCSLSTFIKIKYNNFKALHYNKLNISIHDREFAMNCNVLLYTGITETNKKVWIKIKNDFEKNKIECRYYDYFYALYAYSRLYKTANQKDLLISSKIIAKHLITLYTLYGNQNNNQFNLKHIFLANTIMQFEVSVESHEPLIQFCFSQIIDGKYKELAPYYSSNLIFDKHPEKSEPINFFGSSGLTTCLYIEFLRLYKTRKYI